MTHLDYLNKEVSDLKRILDKLQTRMMMLDVSLRENLDATNEKIKLQIEAKQSKGEKK